jgi:hypothetical protein
MKVVITTPVASNVMHCSNAINSMAGLLPASFLCNRNIDKIKITENIAYTSYDLMNNVWLLLIELT